jgi:hypothetical protein
LRFSAAIQEHWKSDWDGDILILHRYLLDRVTLTSESESEIEDGKGISRLLQILLESGSFYTHYNESLGKAVSRLFIADDPAMFESYKTATMDNKYDIEGGFEKLLFGALHFTRTNK